MHSEESTLERLVRQMTYKPGWSFSCSTGNLWLLRLVAIIRCTDSDDLSKKITVTSRRCISREEVYYLSEQQAKSYLLQWIMEMERHETLEFLRFNGQRTTDPHLQEFVNLVPTNH
jgi:hypothetical protein